MAVNLSPIGNGQQFFDNTGLPLNGGLIYTYQAGSSTPLATYTDVNGTIANANPIVLDSSGRLPSEVWLTYGYNYKFVVKTSTGTTLGTYDNLYGIIGVAGTSTGTTIPTGMISLWYGSIGSVPSGWYLCDGTNGTPDLRDRFVVGAGTTYSVGATGGSTDSVVVSHTHTATTTSTDSGHTHVMTNISRSISASGGGVDVLTGGAATISTQSGTANITSTTTVASAGVSGTNANLPPYYALAYVMKS
jgi:microcystin-dependent protein